MPGRFLFLIIILFTKCAVAQTNVYHPFPDSNAVWRYWKSTICNPGNSQLPVLCGYDYQYTLKGDTFIGGIRYTKMYREQWYEACTSYQWNYFCLQPVFQSYLVALLRNDLANKKVYKHGNPDVVFYDFNLNVGDTLKNVATAMGIVTSIDSVLVGSAYRKRFIADNRFGMVEGIGMTEYSGSAQWTDLFTSSPCACSDTWGFSCFWENGLRSYGDTGCYIISDMEEFQTIKKTPTVYPNPSSTSINIADLALPAAFRLVNSLGEVVSAGQLKSKEITVVNIPNGLYFLNLNDKNWYRIVIEH